MAIQLIGQVESGRFLDDAVDEIFSRTRLSDPQKGLVYQITSGVVRWRGYLDLVLSRYAKKHIDKDVRYLLLMSIYQIGFMKKAHYHVAKEAVEFAKREKGKHVAGFVNAVLRRFVQDRELPAFSSDRLIGYTFPTWLTKRWTERFGKEDVNKLFSALNREPEFTLRIDTGKMTVDEAIDLLGHLGVTVRKGLFSPCAVIVDRLSPVLKSSLFREGLIHVQDEASQLTGMTVQGTKGRVILDACAGSGTKTHQIRQLLPDALVIPMDTDKKRLFLSTDRRNGLCGDALQPPFGKESFDVILVDAPCSSLGIIRKHPEIKWNRQEKEIAAFGAYQLSLIRSLWELLKAGGSMIYSVCSFEPEETFDIIENLSKEKKFILEKPLPFLFNKEYFLSLPHETTMDGFFITRMKKL